MKKIGAAIITFVVMLEFFSLEVNCAVEKSVPSLPENKKEVKVIIGIFILCIITALVTIKRAIDAKKNNW